MMWGALSWSGWWLLSATLPEFSSFRLDCFVCLALSFISLKLFLLNCLSVSVLVLVNASPSDTIWSSGCNLLNSVFPLSCNGNGELPRVKKKKPEPVPQMHRGARPFFFFLPHVCSQTS
jgi:hypothetical protein